MIRTIALAAATLILSGPAAAEITARSDAGFTLSFERPVPASPQAILEAVGHPERWWSSAHTYSGDAANISVDLRPGGCWCETLPGGGVKHAEAVLVWPNQNMVRFEAPFGPLQGIGADAVLTMSWTPVEGQTTRRLRWTFVVNGPGSGAMADAVHTVMDEQFGRLTAALDAAD